MIFNIEIDLDKVKRIKELASLWNTLKDKPLTNINELVSVEKELANIISWAILKQGDVEKHLVEE